MTLKIIKKMNASIKVGRTHGKPLIEVKLFKKRSKYSQTWVNEHLRIRPPAYNDHHFGVPFWIFITSMTSEQRSPVNSGHYFWVPRVVVVHRFDCNLFLFMPANWVKSSADIALLNLLEPVFLNRWVAAHFRVAKICIMVVWVVKFRSLMFCGSSATRCWEPRTVFLNRRVIIIIFKGSSISVWKSIKQIAIKLIFFELQG